MGGAGGINIPCQGERRENGNLCNMPTEEVKISLAAPELLLSSGAKKRNGATIHCANCYFELLRRAPAKPPARKWKYINAAAYTAPVADAPSREYAWIFQLTRVILHFAAEQKPEKKIKPQQRRSFHKC